MPIAAILFIVSCNAKQQNNDKSSNSIDTKAYLKQGDSISATVQKALLSNVMTAMKAGGPVNAVSFCNVHAIPLTDSLAKEHNCLIQRISYKYRNSVNKLTESDLEIWEMISSSNTMKPVLVS